MCVCVGGNVREAKQKGDEPRFKKLCVEGVGWEDKNGAESKVKVEGV